MALKYLFIALIGSMLMSCGDGLLIVASSGNTHFDDLGLTVRVDWGQASGFTTIVGRNDASIFINSGQQLEIEASMPVVFDVALNGAAVISNTTTVLIWRGVVISPENTVITFRITSVDDSSNASILVVNVNG